MYIFCRKAKTKTSIELLQTLIVVFFKANEIYEKGSISSDLHLFQETFINITYLLRPQAKVTFLEVCETIMLQFFKNQLVCFKCLQENSLLLCSFDISKV